jgi:hypothetical protein
MISPDPAGMLSESRCGWALSNSLGYQLVEWASGAAQPSQWWRLVVRARLIRKRHAGDLYSRDGVNVIGIPYDIYERGISDRENGPSIRGVAGQRRRVQCGEVFVAGGVGWELVVADGGW